MFISWRIKNIGVLKIRRQLFHLVLNQLISHSVFRTPTLLNQNKNTLQIMDCSITAEATTH